MTTIHYRMTDGNGYSNKEMIEDHLSLDLKHFADACDQSPEWILQLIEYDILPQRSSEQDYTFWSDDLVRARQAYRLQRDFDASFPAVAMMLDLIDEVQQLRNEMKYFQFKNS
jgi:chaperone modulatory protein CbpM